MNYFYVFQKYKIISYLVPQKSLLKGPNRIGGSYPKASKQKPVFLRTTDIPFLLEIGVLRRHMPLLSLRFWRMPLGPTIRNCCKPHERAPPSPPSFYKSPTFLVCYFEASFNVKNVHALCNIFPYFRDEFSTTYYQIRDHFENGHLF